MEKHFVRFIFILITVTKICSRAADEYSVRDLLRRKRYLVFPDPLDSETKVQVLFGLGLPMEGEISMTLGYVLKCNYDLPYNASVFTDPYVRTERSAKNFAISRNAEGQQDTKGTTSRWSVYRMLETAMGTFGGSRECLLRAVCEAAETPFKEGHGLLGELLHVLLTPSTTDEKHDMYSDQEYHAAERLGGTSGGDCRSFFPECEYSPLDYFTNIGRQ